MCDQCPHQWLKDQEEALKTAKDAMKAEQTRQAFYSDRGRHDPELKVGDQVLVHRQFLLTPEARDRPSDKLRPRWYGPFKITQVINNNAFRLAGIAPLHEKSSGVQRQCIETVPQE